MVLRIMSYLYADKLIASHFNMFRSAEPTPGEKLSAIEERVLARRKTFQQSGRGYFEIQSTKPFTIGLAVASSPLAVLAWVGEKIYSWSDPERVDPTDIIDTVALYFLSGSFATSVLIYNQVRYTADCTYPTVSLMELPQSNKTREDLHSPTATVDWPVKSKFGFSAFVSGIVFVVLTQHFSLRSSALRDRGQPQSRHREIRPIGILQRCA